MNITLSQIMELVGKLDDSPGGDTPRERFRQFLKENVLEIGQLRDYIEECLRISGDQYNRALQDLVNHIGRFLGFDITFGRYQGVQGHIGFDGHWQSPKGYHVIIEVKTSEVYAIKTSSLLGYVDGLISEKIIPNWDQTLGLYVIGRPDPDTRNLENAILAEKRTYQLRVISANSLLSLAELMNGYDVNHEDILSVIKPSGPMIDYVVDLMSKLVAETDSNKEPEDKTNEIEKPLPQPPSSEPKYWLTPVKSDKEETAEEAIQTLVGDECLYAFSERTPRRRDIKSGDWMCFYASTKGIVAHAKIVSTPEKKPHPKVRNPEKYSWVFKLADTKLYLDAPVVLDAALRIQLEAFQGRDVTNRWAWFVQATHSISKHDFEVLIRQ